MPPCTTRGVSKCACRAEGSDIAPKPLSSGVIRKFSMLQFGLTLAGRPQKARYGSSHYLSPISMRRSSDAARGMANALEALAKARLWLDGLIVGRFTSTAEIARHERCSERLVRTTHSSTMRVFPLG